jgi:hypothetical protein
MRRTFSCDVVGYRLVQVSFLRARRMPTSRTPDDLRLNLHRGATAPSRWWSRRPWADALTIVDTGAFVPGRHNDAPPLGLSRKSRPATSLELPATVKLVRDDEAERLEQARRGIDFRPRNGFLVSTPIRRRFRVLEP